MNRLKKGPNLPINYHKYMMCNKYAGILKTYHSLMSGTDQKVQALLMFRSVQVTHNNVNN